MKEEEFEIPNLEEMPLSVKVLIGMAILFAFMSPNMEPAEMIFFLILTFAIFTPMFLADIREAERKA